MKKTYTAPRILFESFAMSTNIAGNCESIVDNPTRGTCAVVSSGGINIFDSSVSACFYTPDVFGGTADTWEGFCYHVPTEYNNLFNS